MWWRIAQFVLYYVAITSLIYRFGHPEMTETELFLHLIDAMLWRW